MSLHFHPLRVREVRLDTEDAVIVAFDVPAELRDTFRFTAGQYLTLRHEVDGQDLRRSYSICAGEDDDVLRVGVRRVDGGAFSSFVHAGLKAEQIHIERFGTPEMQTGRAAPHEVRDGDAQAIVTLIRDGLSRDFEFSRHDPSLLDAAARAGIEVPFSCKSGVCSTCRCKLIEGQVRMDKNFALDKAEVAAGFILSCQAHALTERVVISFDER